MPHFETILAQARGGSREALGELLEACRPFLSFLAEQQLPGDLKAKLNASDLVQETFTEGMHDFQAFAGQTEAELRAWLERILANNACDIADRYRQTDKRCLDREVSLGDSRTGGQLNEQLPGDESTPSQKAIRREEAEAMEQALERLPEDYRRVILLHHRDNLSFAETAQALGRTEAATRRLWARAVERWGQELKDFHESG